MKRACALICAILIAVTMMAPAAFAEDNNSSAAAVKTDLEMVSSSPEDGATGVAVDNLSVKMRFNKDVRPASDDVRQANAKQFKLVDSEGKKIPVKVYYSEDEEGLILVAADVYSGKNRNAIKGDETYTLVVGRNFQAADGSTTGQQIKVGMTTLNQGRSMAIYMILMVLMMAGMVFFTVRSTKNAEKKKKEEREFKDGVNPYKEAKKSGKSVEEVVAKTNKKKAKKEEAIRKQKEAEAAIEAEIIEKIRRESNKRVSSPRAISAAGSDLKLRVVKDSGEKVSAKEAAEKAAAARKNNKGTTNPKNQSGKAKNKKNKGKKKK
ncbi:MAG: Ig-like domain-containing protein [Clostridia bacterium]|nr:Ig-like domain-containing protein [Clostridia bacterium]